MKDTETRAKILDAAQALIQRLGVNAMSYQHISEAVGIRKASIHHHFPTKENLVDTVLDRYAEYFFELVDNILQSKLSPEEKLRKYVDLFEATLKADRGDRACLYGMIGAEIETLGMASAEKVRRFHDGNEHRLTKLLTEGRQKKAFRFKGDPKATAALVYSLLEGALLVVRARGGLKQFRKITDQMTTLIAA